VPQVVTETRLRPVQLPLKGPSQDASEGRRRLLPASDHSSAYFPQTRIWEVGLQTPNALATEFPNPERITAVVLFPVWLSGSFGS